MNWWYSRLFCCTFTKLLLTVHWIKMAISIDWCPMDHFGTSSYTKYQIRNIVPLAPDIAYHAHSGHILWLTQANISILSTKWIVEHYFNYWSGLKLCQQLAACRVIIIALLSCSRLFFNMFYGVTFWSSSLCACYVRWWTWLRWLGDNQEMHYLWFSLLLRQLWIWGMGTKILIRGHTAHWRAVYSNAVKSVMPYSLANDWHYAGIIFLFLLHPSHL